jgi:hypothetical protein
MDKLQVYIVVLRTCSISPVESANPDTHITLATAHECPDATSSSVNLRRPHSSSVYLFRVKTKQTAPYSIDLLHADAKLRNAVIALEAAVKSKAESLRWEKRAYAERWEWHGEGEEFPSVTLEDLDIKRLWRWEIEEKEI